MKRILALEDSVESQRLIQVSLNSKYKVDFADSCQEGVRKARENQYSLFLIDIGLPDATGFDFFQQVVPFTREIPKIFLTADDGIGSILTGFNLGADDYIRKPVASLELLARVDSHIAKFGETKKATEFLSHGPMTLDLASYKAFFDVDGKRNEVFLTPIEFRILLKLVQNPGRVFTRQVLIDQVWGSGNFMEERGVDKHISTLRRKMKPFYNAIKTRSGFGYIFDAQPNDPVQTAKKAETEVSVPPEIADLVGPYLEKRKSDILDMGGMLTRNDYEAVRRTCHRIVGNASPYGFPTLEKLAHGLTEACRKESRPEAQKVLSEMKTYIDGFEN